MRFTKQTLKIMPYLLKAYEHYKTNSLEQEVRLYNESNSGIKKVSLKTFNKCVQACYLHRGNGVKVLYHCILCTSFGFIGWYYNTLSFFYIDRHCTKCSVISIDELEGVKGKQ